MTIMNVLAPVMGGERDRHTLANAMAAARPFGAHVRAFFVRPDPSQVVPYYGDEMVPSIAEEIVTASNEAADRAALVAQAMLKAAADAAGYQVADSPSPGGTASFTAVQGHYADCIARMARLADLVVFGPLKENERPGLTEAFEAVLMETGRPVLLGAQVPPKDFTGHIAVAWNGSLASAHAVSAALPYLIGASTVDLLTVRRKHGEAPPNGDVLEYLQLHGVHASARVIDAADKSVGETLLEAARESGANLLVAGGYGHSRLRTMFVGGVTRQVVSQAALPLFLVH